MTFARRYSIRKRDAECLQLALQSGCGLAERESIILDDPRGGEHVRLAPIRGDERPEFRGYCVTPVAVDETVPLQ
jgi:hypothetical protein